MDRRKLIVALVALLVVAAAAFGLSITNKKAPPASESKAEIAVRQKERLQDSCASAATYGRLKEVAFEEAVRIRNADPANLDTLATHSVVRMENPVVKSRDEELNVTVCTGRFVLELPPGAERGFGGERRLMADVEYAAQAAADGSGLVYQIKGAEPIIYKLASFDLRGQPYRPPVTADETQFAEAAPSIPDPVAVEADVEPQPSAPPPRAAPVRPEPAPRPAPPAPEVRVQRGSLPEGRVRSNPSFNCRSARTRSERMVCGSNQLAARDRSMSSVFYSALADANPRTKRELRRTRDKFLAYRERCGSEACVAEAYDGRVQEIRDIMDAE